MIHLQQPIAAPMERGQDGRMDVTSVNALKTNNSIQIKYIN